MKWLFVTTRFPWPIVDGHWLRVYHLARTLRAQDDEVSVLSFEGDAGVSAYDEVGVHVLPGVKGSHATRGRARSPLGPYAFDQRLADAVRSVAGGYDVVVLSGPRVLQYSEEAAAAGCVVADLIDDPVLEYGRRNGEARSWRDKLRRAKNRIGRPRYEHRFLGSTNVTTFVSEVDCQSFSQRHPTANVQCVANGVDVDHFARAAEMAGDGVGPPRLVFTGHMSNPNNQRAAEFLVKEIAPRVWQVRPEVQLQIVGANPTDGVLSLQSAQVEVTGQVPDMRPYLWAASVVALPMQSGTGIKNKLLEAWAAEAAVVATPIACQGVPAEDGSNLLIGNSAGELAEKIVDVLQDDKRRRSVAKAGRRTVVEQFTWVAAAERLRELARARHSRSDRWV